MQPNPWPLTLAVIAAVIVFGGGTMAAIVLGRSVPPELWPIDGGLVTAVVAHAGFTTLRASGSQAMAHLADVAHAGIATATIPTGGTNTHGELVVPGDTVHTGENQ